MLIADYFCHTAPRRSPVIWLAAAAAICVCALPAAYRAHDDYQRVVGEEETRLSRAADRMVSLMADVGGAPVEAFNKYAPLIIQQREGASMGLGTWDGDMVGRQPEPEAFVGKNLRQDRAYLAHRANDGAPSSGLYERTLTGSPRLIVTRSFPHRDQPSHVLFATRDLSDVLAAWWRRVWLDAAQFLVVAAAVLTFAGMAARREEHLRRSAASAAEREALYHTLFQGNRAVKLLIDPADGALVDVNAAACAFYGYSRDKLLTMRIADINILNQEEIAAEMAAATAEKRSHFFFRHRLAAGEIRDVEIHSGPVQYMGRSLLYSIIHDVTDRRRLEAERARLFTAIEQSQASVVITDTQGTIQYVNPAFTRISGYSAEEIVGENPRILKSGHTSEEEYRAMWRTLTSGEPYSAVFLNKKKDGSLYWEHAQLSPVRDASGSIVSYVAVKENITELKKAEQDLLEANHQLAEQAAKLQTVNAELEQFAYVASHDLRQPLRSISSFLQLIDRKLNDADPEIREFIGYAVSGARRMDRLIVGLLDYSRIGRKSGPLAPTALDEVARISLQTCGPAIEEAGGTAEIVGVLPVVMGDASELQRLLDNMIGNAVKYRAPDRPLQIEIGGATAADRVTFWVADNGVGVDPKDYERIFQMFQRLSAGGDGDGIGLAICKKIIERHGGAIRVESALGEGCRFIIDLPMGGPAGTADGR